MFIIIKKRFNACNSTGEDVVASTAALTSNAAGADEDAEARRERKKKKKHKKDKKKKREKKDKNKDGPASPEISTDDPSTSTQNQGKNN